LDLPPRRHRLRVVRLPILILSSLAVLLSAVPAAAEEELLHGPHPFIKDNELALHAGYAAGLGGNVSGVRMQADFNHRLGQVVWFDLQMGVVSGSCHTEQLTCTRGSGNAVDILAGAAWKFQTKLPLVIHTRVDGGPIFLFPDSTRSAAGILFRGGVGAHYYLYDWFGLGGELGAAYGLAFFRTTPRHTGQLGSIQATVGVTLQF
jgi:hypothetical protein